MKGRFYFIGFFISVFLVFFAGKCSQEHVQSMQENNSGTEYFQRKLYPQAIEHLNRAVTLEDDNEQAHYNLAQVYIQTEQWADAARHLQKVIALHGSPNAMYEYKLGLVLYEMNDNEQSRTHLEKAIELDSKLYKAHFRLGVIYEESDQPENALKKYTDAINANPRFIQAYRNLGALYQDLGYLDEAIQVFQSALQAVIEGSDDEAQIRHVLGAVYNEKEQYNEAIQQFRRALEIRPNMMDAVFSLGWSYKLMGDKENARIYLDRFVKSASEETPAHFVQAAQDALFELEERPAP